MIQGTILIAEDHPIFRDGLVSLMKEITNKDDAIVTAEDLPGALDLARATPDLALITLDLQLPGTHALDGLQTLREEFVLCPIVVVSMLEMGGNVRNVMDMGANGFISKSVSRDQMLDGIKRIIQGEIITLTHEPISEIRLSPRQIDVIKLLAKGLSNKEIAKELNISDITVRDYLSKLMEILEVSNRTQMILEAKRRGMVLD